MQIRNAQAGPADRPTLHARAARVAKSAAAALPVLAAPSREGANRRTVEAGFWPKLHKFMARIPFADEAVAAYFAIRDPATPRRSKLLLLAALAYFITPADAIPDFLAMFGFTDDAAVFWAAWSLARNTVKPAHRALAAKAIEELRNDQADPGQ